MDFQKLVDLYEQLEKISSGNEMREVLAEFFKIVPKEEIQIVTYLTLGKFTPDYQSEVLGLAEKSVLNAIGLTAGVSKKKVKELIEKTGDAGLTAQQLLKVKPRTLVPVGKLTIRGLFDNLKKIAAISGIGSQDKKAKILIGMYQKTSALGAKQLTRVVLGTLRMGVGDMTVLDALAIAFTEDKKNKEFLEQAYNLCPDVGEIAEVTARSGIKGLKKITPVVGRPIRMMLAQRLPTLDDLHKKMEGEVAVEGKYDGERVQVHKDKKGIISLFSRRLENITAQFPDLVDYLSKVKAKDFIAEAEVIAIDETGKLLPFQTLMKRRRKYDIKQYVKKIPIQAKFFDILYLEGKSLLSVEYKERRAHLKKMIKSTKHLVLTDIIVTADLDEINKFFTKKLSEGDEGIMIKSLQGNYQAGTRGWNWIKWKKEYVKDLSDTFDLVIVGAFYGRGKRKGVYGALLCATYNKKEDSFETICKLGTGLTDETLAELPKKLNKSDKKSARLKIKNEMVPDVWFVPEFVIEVLAAEITKSPYHTCGRGYALRFPRFIRFREKKPEQATTTEEVMEMV